MKLLRLGNVGEEIPAAVDKDGKPIGIVTSGTQSPTLSIGIGLGYINIENSKVGNKIGILIRKKNCSAHIVKLPFIKN